MARVLKTAKPAPPLTVVQRTRDLMVHAFSKRPLLNVSGAQQYAYDTFAAPPQSLVGAGTGVKSGAPLGYGQRPMVASPTITVRGVPYRSGQMTFTPLSEPVK